MGTGRSLDCFTKYLPLLNDATAKYEQQYTVCLQNAANSKQRVEYEVEQDRLNVTSSANQICSDYSSCSNFGSSLGYFECTNKVVSGILTRTHLNSGVIIVCVAFVGW